MVLLDTDEQGGSVYGVQLDKETRMAHLCKSSLGRETVFGL